MAEPTTQPWNLSSRTQIQNTQLPGLSDAQNQIRLLRLQSGSGADPIACDYVVYSFSDPLEYIGISYTWGDPTPTHAVTIAGKKVNVHQNCHYALWQARQSYPAFLGMQHFWLDALCIDQSNLHEKSLQVQAMSRIFGCAARVAVSLGPSDNKTGFLDRDLHSLDQHAKDRASGRPDSVIEGGLADRPSHDAYIDLVFPTLPAYRRERIIESYIAFASRPYWSRLWIVQELRAARKIELLCGLVKYDSRWLGCFDLERRLGLDDLTPMYRALPKDAGAQTYSHAFAGSTLPWTSLMSKLQAYRFLSCSDPRDRIYAVLSMLEQPKSLPPLLVDYERSALQLVVDCIHHFSHADSESELIWVEQIGRVTSYLFEGLNVTAEDIRVGQMRSRIGEQNTILNTSPSVSVLAGHRGKEYFVLDSNNRDGHSLNLRKAHFRRSSFENGHWPFLSRLRDLQQENLTSILIKDEVVAVASPGTQSGDILVSMHTGDNESDQTNNCYLSLIMRSDQTNTLRIVGEAFLHPTISPCYGMDYRPGCDYCLGGNEPSLGELQLTFGIDEWTLLMGRFLVSGMSTLGEQLDPATARLYNQSYANILKDNRHLASIDGAKSDESTACDWSSVTITEVLTTD